MPNARKAWRLLAKLSIDSATLDVLQVSARQILDAGHSHRVCNVLAVAHSLRWICNHKARASQCIQVSVQARSPYVDGSLQLTDRAGTVDCQLAQDVHLGPTSHVRDGKFNVFGQSRSDQSRHTFILPDVSTASAVFVWSTLSLNKRVGKVFPDPNRSISKSFRALPNPCRSGIRPRLYAALCFGAPNGD